MHQAVTHNQHKKLKTLENYETLSPKSGHSHLQEVVVHKSFQLQGLGWDNLGIVSIFDLKKLIRGVATLGSSTVFVFPGLYCLVCLIG